MEMPSYFQPAVAATTATTIWRGVILGPDGILMRVRRPVAVILTLVPPTSMTRIFMGWSGYCSPKPPEAQRLLFTASIHGQRRWKIFAARRQTVSDQSQERT